LELSKKKNKHGIEEKERISSLFTTYGEISK